MRILVLSHEYPPVGGGGGRVAQDIAQGLAKRGHEIRILTSTVAGLSGDEMIEGVQVQRLTLQRKAAFRAEFIEMLRYDWSALLTGLKIVRSWKPDVIHAHFAVPAGAVAYLLSRLSGIPYMLTVHLGDVPGAVPEKTDRWFKWIYPFTPAIWKSAGRVVAVSEFTHELALQNYAVPMEVIPNGVDLAALPQHQPSGGVPRIVFAGRFVETKNPTHLVEALAQVKDLPWQCVMLGDGPLLEPVRELAERLGLSARFSLPGWVTTEQVLDQFSRSDILVLPSRSEGLSVVGVQALAMGLAMVMSEVGGNLELVRNGANGFLFPLGDITALAGALRKLLQSSSMLQSAQAKSREMAKKFELGAVIDHYEQFFQRMKA